MNSNKLIDNSKKNRNSNKLNRIHQLKSSLTMKRNRPSSLNHVKKLPINMIISETAYRATTQRPYTPDDLKNLDLSAYDHIFKQETNVDKVLQSLKNSKSGTKSSKGTEFEMYFDKLNNSCLIDDSDTSEDEDSYPLRTDTLLTNHIPVNKKIKLVQNEFKQVDEDVCDIHVEMNGLKVIEIFAYKKTCISNVFKSVSDVGESKTM